MSRRVTGRVFFCSAESLVDIFALNVPDSSAAHFSKWLKLCLWILFSKRVIGVLVIFRNLLALAALLARNSCIKRHSNGALCRDDEDSGVSRITHRSHGRKHYLAMVPAAAHVSFSYRPQRRFVHPKCSTVLLLQPGFSPLPFESGRQQLERLRQIHRAFSILRLPHQLL